MKDADRGESFYINPECFLADAASPEAVGIVMDLVGCIWWPTKSGFAFDEEALAARLAAELPARGYTAAVLRRHRDAVASFFTVLPDGRWAPSPECFGPTDGDTGRRG